MPPPPPIPPPKKGEGGGCMVIKAGVNTLGTMEAIIMQVWKDPTYKVHKSKGKKSSATSK